MDSRNISKILLQTLHFSVAVRTTKHNLNFESCNATHPLSGPASAPLSSLRFVCLVACFLVCVFLLACLLACFLACLLACLLVCLVGWLQLRFIAVPISHLLANLLVCWLVWLLTSLLACLVCLLVACSLCWFACLHASNQKRWILYKTFLIQEGKKKTVKNYECGRGGVLCVAFACCM
jgi:hypothetical protein